MTGTKTKNGALMLCMCAIFTALTAVGAFIKIPIPYMEFTLQFLFTTLNGLLLGGKWGAAAVGAYVFLGLVGVPIFAEGGGFFYVLKPTFGYLIGFTALKPTLTERLQQAETNCRVLRAKIDEVNDILRENPDLSQMYVQKRNELRQAKGLTHKPKPPHK